MFFHRTNHSNNKEQSQSCLHWYRIWIVQYDITLHDRPSILGACEVVTSSRNGDESVPHALNSENFVYQSGTFLNSPAYKSDIRPGGWAFSRSKHPCFAGYHIAALKIVKYILVVWNCMETILHVLNHST